MIGFSTAFTRPKMIATTSSVRTFSPVLEPVTEIPLTRAVATQRATAVTTVRIRNLMRTSVSFPDGRGEQTEPGPACSRPAPSRVDILALTDTGWGQIVNFGPP